MDIQQMRYFLDVAETEHMTRSAERLHIAQPALSRSISRLEEEIGAKLFVREGRGIRLTDEGRLLQRRLSNALSEIDRAKEEIAEVGRVRWQTVRVHIGAASLLAVEALSDWMRANPHARIELVQASHMESPADVVVGPVPLERCQEQRAFEERIMLAIPAETEPGSVPVPLDALSGHPFISLASSLGFRKTCDALCRAHGLVLSTSLESDNPDVVRKAIGLGLGVGFWPERSWGLPGEGMRLVPIGAAGFRRSVHVSLDGENECARSFYGHLVSHMERAFA